MTRSDCSIQTYTAKSIVLVGPTKDFKDEITKLGGKFNNRLTNRETGEKFSAWIFPKTRQSDVEKWISSGEITKSEWSNDYSKPKSNVSDVNLKLILDRISTLEKEVKYLKSRLDDEEEIVIEDEEEEEEEDVAPVRRLLR